MHCLNCIRCMQNSTFETGLRRISVAPNAIQTMDNEMIHFMTEMRRTKQALGLGAVHMNRASPANRADLSHENLYFSTI